MDTIPTAEMKATIRKTEEATWNGRDPAAFDEIATDDYVMHDPMGDHDLAGFRGIVQSVLDGAPDLAFAIEDMFAADDRLVIRYTLEGTNEAPSYLTEEPTGKHWRSTGISIFRFEGDEVAEQWDAFDYLGTMRQLGLVSSEAATETGGGEGAAV